MTKKSQKPEDVFGVIRLFRQMEKNGWSDRAYADWKRSGLEHEKGRNGSRSIHIGIVSADKWPVIQPDKKTRAHFLVDYKRG